MLVAVVFPSAKIPRPLLLLPNHNPLPTNGAIIPPYAKFAKMVIAYALPEKYYLRKIAMMSFIAIGTVDTVRNYSMGLKFAW